MLRRLRRHMSLADDGGFSTAELIIAASVIFVVATGVMGAMSYAAHSSAYAQAYEKAINLANQRVEAARNLPYDNLGTINPGGSYGDPPGSIPVTETLDGYRVTTDVEWARDESTGRATYKQVSVGVAWDEPRPGGVDVSTAVYSKSEIVNAGDLGVRVVDRDTGDPVTGAAVQVTPSDGLLRLSTTDTNGESFYGYLPAGPCDVDVSVAGKLVDLRGMDSVNISADAITRVVIYVQEPSTCVVEVVDTEGTPIPGAQVTLTDASGNALDDTSDGSGVARFEDLFVDDYTVDVSADGYGDGTAQASIQTGGEEVRVTVQLAEARGLVVAVTDSNGAPLASADVAVFGPWPSNAEIDSSPGQTVSNGEASFSIDDEGWYWVEVSKSGYEDVSDWVWVPSDGTRWETQLQAVEETTGTLTVYVGRNNGDPRSNQRVRVWGPGGYYADERTGADGTVFLEDLAPGNYWIWHAGRWRSVSVSVGQNSYAEFVY